MIKTTRKIRRLPRWCIIHGVVMLLWNTWCSMKASVVRSASCLCCIYELFSARCCVLTPLLILLLFLAFLLIVLLFMGVLQSNRVCEIVLCGVVNGDKGKELLCLVGGAVQCKWLFSEGRTKWMWWKAYVRKPNILLQLSSSTTSTWRIKVKSEILKGEKYNHDFVWYVGHNKERVRG